MTISLLFSTKSINGAFPYALTNSDLPEGFELQETVVSSEANITQLWKTPGSLDSTIPLQVINFSDAFTVNTVFSEMQLSEEYNVSIKRFSGSPIGLNVSLGLENMYWASIETFIVSSNGTIDEFDDIEILIEAQIFKINTMIKTTASISTSTSKTTSTDFSGLEIVFVSLLVSSILMRKVKGYNNKKR